MKIVDIDLLKDLEANVSAMLDHLSEKDKVKKYLKTVLEKSIAIKKKKKKKNHFLINNN